MKKNEKEPAKRIINYPLMICFTIFISIIFILSFLMEDKEISEWENRYLTMRPSISAPSLLDGSFMSKYEDYINDQMPFRDGFIKLKALSETALFKVENNGIAKGRNSYLFTKGKDDTSVFDKNIGIISKFSENLDNKVIVAIAPNASGVLSSFVPKGFLMPVQAKKLDELIRDNSLLKTTHVIDLKSALMAHGDEYIYYKTDHHWTTRGAYLAYREISENPMDIKDIEKEHKEELCQGFLGTLYAKYKGLIADSDVISYYDIPVRKFITDDTERRGLLDKEKLSVFDKYGMFLYGNFGKCEIDTFADNGKSAVIFKDSYANCLIPFLTYDYEKITVIDLRYYNEPVSDLLEKNKDADVLFIHNFDFLNEDNHFYKLMK